MIFNSYFLLFSFNKKHVHCSNTDLPGLSADKLSQKSNSNFFYLIDCSLTELLNNLLSPKPFLVLQLKILPRTAYFFRNNKIPTQKIPQKSKIVHYTATLSADNPSI